MARKKSYQKGSVRLHRDQWTLRYREFDHSSRRWINKRELLGTFKDKKTALRAAEPIMARVNERNNSAPKPAKQAEITFREFVAKRWKAYTVSHQPSSIDSRNSLIKNHVLPFLGDKLMTDITPGDISDLLYAARKKISASTVQDVYGLLSLMFSLAVEYELIERSPIKKKLHKPEVKRAEKPTLTAEQIRSILARLVEHERLAVLVIAITGMRMGECFALRWTDFDADALSLAINHTLYRGRLKPPKTERSRRPLKIPPIVASLLLAHKRQSAFQAPGDFIFCRPDGRPLHHCVVRNHLYKAMDVIGIERISRHHGFHILRHSAGSLIYARSRDLKLVQKTLGHSLISTTSDIYVHLDQCIISEGTEILTEEILGKCTPTAPQQSKLVS